MARRIVRPDPNDITAILDATQLDRFLRTVAGKRGGSNGQILVIAKQDYVASAVRAGIGVAVIGEAAVEDLNTAQRVGQSRRAAIASTDVGKAILDGVCYIDIVEHDRAGKGG
ncbi:MAG: hypothetical protein FAZ92_02732 [Accumulibacter sp.]|nr:MAG: hypothetical protein FAZ92_02732 [Accumulibacter sp.]